MASWLVVVVSKCSLEDVRIDLIRYVSFSPSVKRNLTASVSSLSSLFLSLLPNLKMLGYWRPEISMISVAGDSDLEVGLGIRGVP